jgi:AraC family transcriptional regulator
MDPLVTIATLKEASAMQTRVAGNQRSPAANGAYGHGLSSCFGVTNGPSFVKRDIKMAAMAVTEVKTDHATREVSQPIPVEDAFLVVLQLRDFPDHVAWEGGRQSPIHSFRTGDVMLKNLLNEPTVLITEPLHFMDFYLPRATLNTIAEDASAPRIADLTYRPGEPIHDMVIRNLGQSLRGVFDRPEQANQLFLDHVMMAVATHVARTYGGMKEGARLARGGLAGWQESRAKEVLAAHLADQVALQDVADACSLSVSHFSRAFRETTGFAPYQWLMRHRIEAAKSAMQDVRLSLADIALACGFSDQSHFTRVFSKQMGISPGCWRRYADIRPTEPDTSTQVDDGGGPG